VLTNYAGRAQDVATLAHELGHAVHAMMAADHSVLTFHSALPLAETASVFGEMLLTERLLAQESDPAVRRDLLANAIDDAYATVQRQAFFTLFERDAHRLVVEGKTIDELAARYLGNLAEQFGDSVEVGDEFRWEWVAIPHFYFAPFYTYAYSFGQLLVLALYRQYQAEGEAFKPRYLKILAYGGSEAPATILGEAGIDIASPEFWQGGFEVIKGLIDELEQV
jgi:oligoendopeptidase F